MSWKCLQLALSNLDLNKLRDCHWTVFQLHAEVARPQHVLLDEVSRVALHNQSCIKRVHVCTQAASSALPDQAPDGICVPLGATNPPSEAIHPPQDMTDPAQDETDAEQPALDADPVGANCNQQADHANQQGPYANQDVMLPAEVQQAKQKPMVPIFRRRTCALPVSTAVPPQGPTHLRHLLDSTGPEGPIDLGPSSRDAAEDMIEEDLQKGISIIMIAHQCHTCERSGCVDQ